MPATPTSSVTPSRLLGASAAELKFRIQGGEHDGRILRITGPKCTIGSARGCTLRLRGYGIEPLHCLILAGRNGTVIRRNSPRTYLNGGTFQDAELKAGDILRVGPVELAVVACPKAVSSSQSSSTIRQQPVQEPAELADLKREQQRLTSELATMGEELRAAREQLKQARQDNGEPSAENTRLVTQLREQYAEALQRFLDQRAAALIREEELQDELNRAQQHAQDEDTRFAQREAAWQKQLEDQRQDVSALQQAMTSIHDQRAQERAAAGAERQQLEEKVATLKGLLQEARQQAPERKPTDGNLLDEQAAELAARLADRELALAHRGAELVELRQQVVRLGEADLRVRQLEEKLQLAALAQQAEREAWQQEKSSLEAAKSDLVACQRSVEFQAALDQEAMARCESLEKQITELQTRLQQALSSQTAAQTTVDQAAAQMHEQQIQRWQSESHTWQLQAEEINGQLRDMKQLCSQQETEIAEFKAAAHSDQVALSESQAVEALRSQLEMQRQELAEARLQFQQEQAHLARVLAETSSREEVLAHFEAELREREAAGEHARAEQASALEERSQLIASQIEQFEAEQAAFSRQQATIIQQMSSLEDRVQELTTASESRTTNSPFVIPRLDDSSLRGGLEQATQPYVRAGSALGAEATICMTQLMDLRQPRVAAEAPPEPVAEPTAEPAVEPAVEPAAGEVNSVVNRLMQAGLWKGDESDPQEHAEPAAEEPAPVKPAYTPPTFLDQAAEMVRQEELAGTANQQADVAPPQATSLPQHVASSPPAGGAEDDDSIEQYMNRLLSRVRGDAAPSASVPLVREEEADQEPSEEIAPVEVEKPAEPKEYVPRAAPEQPERLSLMRELANSAAQSAIHTHARQHQKRETKAKSLVALLSLIGAVGLFTVACATHSLIAMAGSMIFIAICCVMSMRALAGSIRQMRLKRPQEIGEVPEVAPSAPQSEQKANPA